MFPELGVMVGHALTVTMDSQPGPVADREEHGKMWEALLTTPRPSVVVVKDLTGAPSRCAYFGEVMASVAKACGAVGVISDGGLRDIAEVRAMACITSPLTLSSHMATSNRRCRRVGDARRSADSDRRSPAR